MSKERELSNSEAIVRLAYDFIRYSPRRCLEEIRENPVKSTGLAMVIAGAGASLMGRADIGYPVMLFGAAVYFVGMSAEGQRIKDGIGSLVSRTNHWWTDYKRR